MKQWLIRCRFLLGPPNVSYKTETGFSINVERAQVFDDESQARILVERLRQTAGMFSDVYWEYVDSDQIAIESVLDI